MLHRIKIAFWNVDEGKRVGTDDINRIPPLYWLIDDLKLAISYAEDRIRELKKNGSK